MSQQDVIFVRERYRLEELLGRGGMGSVYRAYDRLTGHWVALKIVSTPKITEGQGPVFQTPRGSAWASGPDKYAQSEPPARAMAPRSSRAQTVAAELQALQPARASRVAVARNPSESTDNPLWARMALAQEFRTLAALRHPHIISVLDYGFISRSEPFFTMELLEHGKSLHEASEGLPLQDKAELLAQLLRALSYLHRHGILHRDLKPANVLVITDSDGPKVKLLDFGVALARWHGQAERAEIAGTLSYLAPELFEGRKVSEAADLFAVGLVAYEVFTGQHPFDRGDDSQLVASLLGRDPDWQPLHQHPRLVSLLRCLLAKSPAARPSADEALTRLLEALNMPRPQETAALRESTLQAARFVGREQPLALLRAAMDQARAGAGGLWLLGGESGVGKSRLMEELRVHCLVQGGLSVRGQAVSEGGGSYALWREILRTLCLGTELDALDASVLKSILPDLEALLDRAIPEAPALNPQAAQLRLINVIESLLLRQTQPLLLLLEDLHWTDAESLAILRRLAPSCRTRPLLIVASYRHDECPDLPSDLPGCPVLKLARLSTAGIAELCQSMLGGDACTPELVAFLEAETEGNVFFIIEVMRALAEEAGQLSHIDAHRLPKQVLTGGIQAIVQRRLARLPEEALPLLRLAAVAGRQLDLAMLRRFEDKLQSWLYLAANAAVLEVSDQAWRFAHDKIRESLLLELSPAATRQLHLLVADTLAITYPGSAPHAAALAEHYQRGGSPAKAAFYLVEAGVHALSQGATEAASVLLKQALAPAAQALLSRTQAARAHNGLIQAKLALGRVVACIETYEQFLGQLGLPVTADLFSLSAAAGAVFVPQLRRLPSFALMTQDDRSLWSDVAYATRWASEAYVWAGQPRKSILAALQGAALAESLGDQGLQSYFQAVFSYLAGLVPLQQISQRFLASGSRMVEGLSSARAELDFRRVVSARHMNAANWELARSQQDAVIALSRQIGDEYSLLFALSQRMVSAFRQDQELVFESLREELSERASRSQSSQFARVYPMHQGLKALRRGDVELARQRLAEAEVHLQKSPNLLGRVQLGGFTALCLLQDGKYHSALLRARDTLALVEATQFSNEVLGEGIAAIVEVYLGLWEASSEFERPSLLVPLRQALSALRRCARIFPSGAPRALLWHGRHAWNHGASRLAQELAKASQRRATRLGMPFDEALANKWLARFVAAPPAAASGLGGEIRGILRLLTRH